MRHRMSIYFLEILFFVRNSIIQNPNKGDDNEYLNCASKREKLYPLVKMNQICLYKKNIGSPTIPWYSQQVKVKSTLYYLRHETVTSTVEITKVSDYNVPRSLNFFKTPGSLSLNKTGSARNSTAFSGIEPYSFMKSVMQADRSTMWPLSADNITSAHSGHLNFLRGTTCAIVEGKVNTCYLQWLQVIKYTFLTLFF